MDDASIALKCMAFHLLVGYRPEPRVRRVIALKPGPCYKWRVRSIPGCRPTGTVVGVRDQIMKEGDDEGKEGTGRKTEVFGHLPVPVACRIAVARFAEGMDSP